MFLSVESVSKRYGEVVALSDTTLAAKQGEILALLGPSGCGKTTLLNLIAGFLRADSGLIRVGGRDLTGVPPDKRGMGMVFQSYALFPHMTVERNIAFGLESQGVPRGERGPRIDEALARVGLTGFETRYPAALSAGQQQRVALARALVVRPSILLLDEPLSNLDTQLRKEMQEDLRVILRGAGMTAVLVTHDQQEALVVADRVLLMSGGRIEQDGTPEEIFERPRTVSGARFMDATNLIEGTVTRADAAGVETDTAIGAIHAEPATLRVGSPVTLMVRPERIRLLDLDDSSLPENRLQGRVLRSAYLGTTRRLHVAVGKGELTVDVPAFRAAALPEGSVLLGWQREDTHVLTA